LKDFENGFEQFKEMLRRFDEVISGKANKTALIAAKEQADNDYMLKTETKEFIEGIKLKIE
jgi:hypothetical protein